MNITTDRDIDDVIVYKSGDVSALSCDYSEAIISILFLSYISLIVAIIEKNTFILH